MRINLHRPTKALWIIALVLFIWGLLPLPYRDLALIISAALSLLGTTVI